MYASLGDDVGVEAVAEFDGVDIVAFEIRVHDGEEHLQEEVDGVNEDGEQEEPERASQWDGTCKRWRRRLRTMLRPTS